MILELIWNSLRPSVFLKQCRRTLMKESSQKRMTSEAEMHTEFIRNNVGREQICVRRILQKKVISDRERRCGLGLVVSSL
jgi:hypothetical protein